MPVTIEPEDLRQLAQWFPKLQFDTERSAVLLHSSSCDVQAAPGSGKTTLLGAKLALIADKWPYTRRGVCVLSHTNVARSEIESRLRATPNGAALLSYPHFVGTIQSFVHTYLALPYLRAHDITVEVVDDAVFEDRAFAFVEHDWTLRAWLKNAEFLARPVIANLRWEGADLSLGVASGKLPGPGKSLPRLQTLKEQLSLRGIFRYDDMFAFAAALLKDSPSTAQAISHRFPLLFVDEMQDTSGAQEHLLHSVFGQSVVQRYGDINQAILGDSSKVGASSFPVTGCLNISSSLRFPASLANIANRLRREGVAVVGLGGPAARPATILVYDDATIANVVPHYGQLLSQIFTAEELLSGAVKAVCAKKQGQSQKGLGRHILDYWPTYDSRVGGPAINCATIIEVVRHARISALHVGPIAANVGDARGALLRILRIAGCGHAKQYRSWHAYERALKEAGADVAPLQRLVHEMVLASRPVATPEGWEAAVRAMHSAAATVLQLPVTPEAVLANADLAFIGDVTLDPVVQRGNRCKVDTGAVRVAIDLCTIAGVKGETHLATLVLESFRKSSFDICAALPYLCEEKDAAKVSTDTLARHLKNLFVAVTRPRRFLCLATHKARLPEAYETKLRALGWLIEIVPTPEKQTDAP
jgi:DNA helicase-2/ATP-dependent DNA helicase PcrA